MLRGSPPNARRLRHPQHGGQHWSSRLIGLRYGFLRIDCQSLGLRTPMVPPPSKPFRESHPFFLHHESPSTVFDFSFSLDLDQSKSLSKGLGDGEGSPRFIVDIIGAKQYCTYVDEILTFQRPTFLPSDSATSSIVGYSSVDLGGRISLLDFQAQTRHIQYKTSRKGVSCSLGRLIGRIYSESEKCNAASCCRTRPELLVGHLYLVPYSCPGVHSRDFFLLGYG